MGESSRPAVVMISLFVVILISYLAYIMLLHPWDRKALLTTKATILVNLYDCDSGYPITDALVKFYNDDGKLLSESMSSNGSVTYSDLPDCYRIKTSYSSNITRVCVDSGENRVINLCYEHPEANPFLLLYEGRVGAVGASGGKIITNRSFGNVVLSYPVKNYSLAYPSAFLFSNMLWGEGADFNITNIHPEITQGIHFNFYVNSVKGTPVISVYLEKDLLYKGEIARGDNVSVEIPRQNLKGNMTLRVKCNFNDWKFWTTQFCELSNITFTQKYFSPEKVSQNFSFEASLLEKEADKVTLNFTSSMESGGVEASINGEKIFDSNSLEATDYSASLSEVNLSDENTLVFEAKPGTEAFLRGISLSFEKALSGNQEKEYEFKINDDIMNKLADVRIDYFVTNVMLGGHIWFNINNAVYTDRIDKAGWHHLIIDKEDLLNDNKLVITSPDAEFLLEELKISYE